MTQDLALENIKLAASHRISLHGFESDPAFFEHMSERQLRDSVSNFIARERMTTNFGEDYIEKRIVLYVASPEKFWELVNERARDLCATTNREAIKP